MVGEAMGGREGWLSAAGRWTIDLIGRRRLMYREAERRWLLRGR